MKRMLEVLGFSKGQTSKVFSENVKDVVNQSSYGFIEYPIVPFKQYIEYYLRDPVVMSVADFIEQLVAGMGGYTTAEDNLAKDMVDDFNTKINLDELHLKVAKWASLCGNFFLERVYDNYDNERIYDPLTNSKIDLVVPSDDAVLIDIKPVPISSIISATVSNQGVLYYTQVKMGKVIKLSPRILVHYRWNSVDEGIFGIGWFTSMLTHGFGFVTERGKVKRRDPFIMLKERMDDAAMKLAIKSVPRHVYVFPGRSPDSLREIQSMIERLEPEQDFLTNVKDFDVREIGVTSRAMLDFFWRHIFDQFIIGTQTHHIRLFTTPGFTEASARVADAAMERKLMAIRRFIKRITEREIFNEFLRTHGIDPLKANVRWNWGLREEPKIEIEHLIKFAELLSKDVQVVRVDELRRMLRRIGFMLTEQE